MSPLSRGSANFDVPAASVEWWVGGTTYHRNEHNLDCVFNDVHGAVSQPCLPRFLCD